MLATLRAAADLVIDTSSINIHQLSSRVVHFYGTESTAGLRVTLVSFGFKNGLPVDSDLVFDVRFLPNPHWVPELRPFSGKDEAVSDYVMAQPGAVEFLDQYAAVVAMATDGYKREGKRYLTIAVGCTGGKHRSVASAIALASRLEARGIPTTVSHRNLGRE